MFVFAFSSVCVCVFSLLMFVYTQRLSISSRIRICCCDDAISMKGDGSTMSPHVRLLCARHTDQTARTQQPTKKVTCAVFVYYHISNYKNTKIWRIISIDFIFGFNGLTSGRLEIVRLRIICFVSVVLKCLLQRAFSVAATMRTTHTRIDR